MRRTGILLLAGLLTTACGGDDDGSAGDIDGGGDGDQFDGAPRFDAEPSPDARPADLTCADDEPATTAPDPVTMNGYAFTLEQLQEVAVQGVAVKARNVSDDTQLAMDNSDSMGVFDLSAATGAVPLDAYLYATKNGYLPTRVYPPEPVSQHLAEVPTPILDQDLLDALLYFSGQVEQDPEKGVILGVVVDCAAVAVEGASVTTDPAAGDVVYADDDGLPDTSRTTTAGQGIVFLFNVPAGDVVINAERGGESFQEHTVKTVPGENTATVILP